MRYLPDVISRMLKHIPPDQEFFRKELESLGESASFSAPENIQTWWGEVALTLTEMIPGDFTLMNEWQARVAKIWLDQESEDAVEGEHEFES